MLRHRTVIIIPINEALSDDGIHTTEREPGSREAVHSACASDRARHLMLVGL